MNDRKPIVGTVFLVPEAKSVPEGGLGATRLRVELVEKVKPNSAWIAELKVLGELPWYRGEDRKVEVRVMAEEFRNVMTSREGALLVRRGSDILGTLILEK